MFVTIRVKQFLYDAFDIISFLVFVGGIVLFIRFFVANPYTVVGASMVPTFHENDFIIVDKITPKLRDRKRGDIIVFVPPGKTVPYIKRVIGLPGEMVRLQDGKVFICSYTGAGCYALEESYLPQGIQTKVRCGVDVFFVHTGGLFVLGDNRGFSTDSSCCFGLDCYKDASYLVPYDHIIGKVYIRLFPGFSFY